MLACSVVSVVPTLCKPVDCCPPDSCPWDFPDKDIGLGVPCPPPWDVPIPEIQPSSPVALALQADSLAQSHWGSPY